MDPLDTGPVPARVSPGNPASDATLAQLVGNVYEQAPATERCRLLEQLLRPLGVLSLAVVANGIFSKIRFRAGWQDFRVRPDDLQNVRVGDVVALVDFIEKAGVDAVDRLSAALATSPVLASTAAAALLLAMLMRRERGAGVREARPI